MVSFGSWLDNRRHILMQYTGLKDKKGKEIYEGDLVASDMDIGNDTNAKFEIIWSSQNACFSFRSKYDESETIFKNYIFKGNWKTFEVIGNIYENKELL